MSVRAEQQALAKWGLNYVMEIYTSAKARRQREIVDSDRIIKTRLGTAEGVIGGDVTLDPARKITKRPRSFSR